MLTRKRQVAFAIESVEGTAETLTAANAKLYAYDPKITFEPEMHDPAVAGIASSQMAKVSGKRPGTYKTGFHINGSGAAATDPEWIKLLRACGFASSTLSSITIGAITSGPLVHGETITGGTSNATGRVIKRTVTGTTTLYFVSTSSATFQNGEVITGGTSGATATTGSLPSTAGKVMEPIESSIPSLTMAGYEDGLRKLLKGCRGSKIKFDFKTGKVCLGDVELKGVEAGVADVALLSGVTRETSLPPAFLSAAFTCDAVAMKFSELSISIDNTIVPRDDPSESRGIASFAITPPQKITVTMDPEMLLAATHDFHTKWFAGTTMVLDFMLGTTAGNKYEFYAPAVQYDKVDDDARDGLAVGKVSATCTGSVDKNDAFAILQL